MIAFLAATFGGAILARIRAYSRLVSMRIYHTAIVQSVASLRRMDDSEEKPVRDIASAMKFFAAVGDWPDDWEDVRDDIFAALSQASYSDSLERVSFADNADRTQADKALFDAQILDELEPAFDTHYQGLLQEEWVDELEWPEGTFEEFSQAATFAQAATLGSYAYIAEAE